MSWQEICIIIGFVIIGLKVIFNNDEIDMNKEHNKLNDMRRRWENDQ